VVNINREARIPTGLNYIYIFITITVMWSCVLEVQILQTHLRLIECKKSSLIIMKSIPSSI